MKSFKMKALAVAVLGLAGLGVMGSAMAVCPVANTTKGTITPGGGGAWTSQFIATDATLDIPAAGPGLNGTACALSVSIGALSNSRVFVQDSSPQNEPRYRARFYVSLANLFSSFTVSNQTGIVFRANDTTGPAAFTSDELVMRIAGGGSVATPAPTVRFFVSDSNPASGATQVVAALPASATHVYRIEFDLQLGAAATSGTACNPTPATGGCFRYWVTDAAAASTDAAPTGSITVNNAAWSGAKTAFLGLTTGTGAYRTNHAGTVLILDEFDSRRQTFIGQ